MEIKNNIAININKEVTLALLSINESMNLKHIIFHLKVYLISLIQVVRLSLIQDLRMLGAWVSRSNLRLRVLNWVLESEETYRKSIVLFFKLLARVHLAQA